jgi:hypothetical protein
MKYLFLTVSIFVAGCSNNTGESIPNPPGVAILQWQDTVLELGTIEEGKAVFFSFYCKNIGNAPLIYKKIESTCGCTTIIRDSNKVIRQGQRDSIQAVINIQHEIGPVTSKIYVLSNAQKEFQVLKIKANVIKKG